MRHITVKEGATYYASIGLSDNKDMSVVCGLTVEDVFKETANTDTDKYKYEQVYEVEDADIVELLEQMGKRCYSYTSTYDEWRAEVDAWRAERYACPSQDAGSMAD